MKRFLKSILFGILWFTYSIIRVFKVGDNSKIVVLMYHSIGDGKWKFSTAVRDFEKQIQYLKDQGYKFLRSSELLDLIIGNVKLYKAVLITFDDGYKDFIDNALPILKKYNASAAMFINTDRRPENLNNNLPIMTLEDVVIVSNNGIEIGSHTHSHPDLKKINTDEIYNEVKKSSEIIENSTRKKPEIFAYPRGKFNQQAIDILKENGYKLGFTIDRGLINIGDDVFRIKRFGLANDTTFLEFKCRLTPISDWYEKISCIFKLKTRN